MEKQIYKETLKNIQTITKVNLNVVRQWVYTTDEETKTTKLVK